MIEASFQIKPERCWAQKLSQEFPDITMTVFSIHQEKGLSRWECEDSLQLRAALEKARADDTLVSLDIFSQNQNEIVVQSVCRCENRYKVHDILSRGGCYYLLPNPIVTCKGAKHYRILAPDADKLRNVVEMLQNIGEVKITAVHPLEHVDDSFFINVVELKGLLSEKQLRTLKRAYLRGYFEIPKRARIKDLADELGLSPATVYEQLAEGENRIIASIIDYL
ncbi:MAG: helix-turn-helix domain-containing protein [Theionarchaea archaeon]|nr:helix-turn-helix domain-containing protein [Theionarchaea archaeon]MBU7000118.1 helix-turn-helix domain-containing protein [Theionarchaea archaeon]MBU7020835.1 helix-turn-helix domain-containing protein [Theionarchaea archaeon]MBU7033929.1 helix-turn-helix domain-containing protein [Theionarchaea archaeon]MBU7039225.1 helix-turn-helix domain-containing protein [Theionarchaea archaeon]